MGEGRYLEAFNLDSVEVFKGAGFTDDGMVSGVVFRLKGSKTSGEDIETCFAVNYDALAELAVHLPGAILMLEEDDE